LVFFIFNIQSTSQSVNLVLVKFIIEILTLIKEVEGKLIFS